MCACMHARVCACIHARMCVCVSVCVHASVWLYAFLFGVHTIYVCTVPICHLESTNTRVCRTDVMVSCWVLLPPHFHLPKLLQGKSGVYPFHAVLLSTPLGTDDPMRKVSKGVCVCVCVRACVILMYICSYILVPVRLCSHVCPSGLYSVPLCIILPPSLSLSLPPSLSLSLLPPLPHSVHPSLSLSLPPFLSPSFPPSLPLPQPPNAMNSATCLLCLSSLL